MPIFSFQEKRVLYVHVPKTGGTSIERLFIRNGFSINWIDGGDSESLLWILKCPPQHLHAEMLMQLLHLDRFDFIFMTVRHPVDRIMSEYAMGRTAGYIENPFGDWLRSVFDAYEEDKYVLDNHIRPQIKFLLPTATVYRQEDGFNGGWVGELSQRTGWEFHDRSMERALSQEDGRQEPSLMAAERTLIEQFYEEDFGEFGYE